MDVTLPDGTVIHDVPDGTTKAQLSAKLSANGMTPPTDEPATSSFGSVVSNALDMVKKGAQSLGRGAGQALEGEQGGLDALIKAKTGVSPLTVIKYLYGPQKTVDDVLPHVQAETPAGKFAVSGLEGVGGALAGGGANVPGVISGALSGMGGEAASQLLPGTGELGRAVGNVAGGGIGALSALRTNAPREAAKVLEGISSEDLAAAVAKMSPADLPAGLNLSQALDKPSNVDDMIRLLANSPAGDKIITQLRAQPPQVASAATSKIGALPGHQLTPVEASNDAQSAATDVLANARQSAGRLAAIPPGTQVAGSDLAALDAQLQTYAQAHPNTDAAGMAMEVHSRLFGAPTPGTPGTPPAPVGSGPVSSRIMSPGAPATPPTPNPLTDASQLKAAIDDAIQGYGSNRLNTGAAARDLNRYATQIRSLVNNTIFPQTSVPGAARTVSGAGFAQTVDPLEKSVIGRVAGVTGSADDREAVDKLTALFKKGTPVDASTGQPLGQSEILALQRTLASTDPAVFTNAVKTYLGNTLSNIPSVSPGRTATDFAKQITTALAGTPAQQAGLRDMLAGVARSQGLNEPEFVSGFMKFMDTAGRTANRPNAVSGVPELAQTAGQGGVVTALQSMTPGRLGNTIQQALSSHAYRTMDALLTTPEGIATLQKLARSNAQSPQAANAVATFLAGVGSQEK